MDRVQAFMKEKAADIVQQLSQKENETDVITSLKAYEPYLKCIKLSPTNSVTFKGFEEDFHDKTQRIHRMSTQKLALAQVHIGNFGRTCEYLKEYVELALDGTKERDHSMRASVGGEKQRKASRSNTSGQE